MTCRAQSFTVETRRKPGLAIRAKTRSRGPLPVFVTEHETSAGIEFRLGVVTVGVVTHNPANNGIVWALFLPGMSVAPKPAKDVHKARLAVRDRVREWCEAARLVQARRSRQ
jgi:hypothetical protein